MVLSLINFSLVCSASINLLLIWLLSRQQERMPMRNFYNAIVALIFLDNLAVIYIINAPGSLFLLLIAKIKLILECGILAMAYYLGSHFTLASRLPKMNLRTISVALAALILAIAAAFDLVIADIQLSGKIHFVTHPPYGWILVTAYITLVLYLLYKRSKIGYPIYSNPEPGKPRRAFQRLSLLAILVTLLLFAAPYLLETPLIYLNSYLFLALLLCYGALKTDLLEFTEKNRYLLPLAIISALFLLIFYLLVGDTRRLETVLISIPIFLCISLFGYYGFLLFDYLKNKQIGYHEAFYKRMELFSAEIGKFIDPQQLWQFLGNFCKETFGFSNIAVITCQHDVSPYQITYLKGFLKTDLNRILKEENSAILEKLESTWSILNRAACPPGNPLFREMAHQQIYFGVPMIKQNKMMGIIFLGDRQAKLPAPGRYVHLLKIMSAQIASAIENIYTIQSALQAQKMAGIGMLTSQLAHDFQSFIGLIKHTAPPQKHLARHTAYMEKMVQDLLNYSRPDKLKLRAVDVNQLLDMGLSMFQIPADIQIEKHYAENLPKIQLDMTQIRRVFINLLDNSIRAMHFSNGNRIKITTRQLRPLSKISQTPWLYIEILDEGVGIPEEFLERVFDPFFTTYKKVGGNGLGLAIVKQIITRHSGFIDVSSKSGKGTIFNIRLPYQNVSPG